MKRKRIEGYFGFVYMFRMDRFIKIGRSKVFSNRHDEYFTSLPKQPEFIIYRLCVDYINVENGIHKKYKPYRSNKVVQRGEWYELTDSQIEEIKNIIRKEAVTDQAMVECATNYTFERYKRRLRFEIIGSEKNKEPKKSTHLRAIERRLKANSIEEGHKMMMDYLQSICGLKIRGNAKKELQCKARDYLGLLERTLGNRILNKEFKANAIPYVITLRKDFHGGRYWQINEYHDIN